MPDTDYYCNFDIRNEWHNGFFLWAGHNCEIYDLTLKIFFPKDAYMNRKLWMSSDMDCLSETCNTDSDECEAVFKITPNNPRLGVGFDSNGPPVNFRFETQKWEDCVDGMNMV